MQTETENAFEESARLRKARALVIEIDAALANVFVDVDPTSALACTMVANFGEKEWAAFSARAKVHMPSDATKACVLDLYRRRAQAAGNLRAEVEQLEELAEDPEETDLGEECARAARENRRAAGSLR